jgi:hypothetical protein
MSVTAISFVGQCHTVGYAGVPADAAFPRVCRDVVQAARPEVRVEVRLHPCYHPAELVESVQSALRRQPRVVVVEVIGWLAVTGTAAVDLSRLPKGVRSAYERVKHFRHVARHVTRNAPRATAGVMRVETAIGTFGHALLRPLLPRHARPSIAEYEQCLGSALDLIAASQAEAVVQGPGAPNTALDGRGLAPDALERYRAMQAMARRVAESRGALFVDRWDTTTPRFYSEGSVRPSLEGHSMWGHLLATELLRAGIV